MSYERIGEQEQRLRAEIESLLQRAEEADQSEDHPRANERPHVLAGLARRPKRSRSNVMTTSHRVIRGIPPWVCQPIASKRHQRASPIPRRNTTSDEARALYARRKAIVEPVFGQIKEVRGFRRFLLRGMRKVAGEWSMLTATHNLLKLFRNASQAAPA